MKQRSITNDFHEFSDVSHDSFAQVGLIVEQLKFCHDLGDRIMLISLDDMAMFKLGNCPLVSRYHQPNRLHSLNHSGPQVHDHDFSEATITPSRIFGS